MKYIVSIFSIVVVAVVLVVSGVCYQPKQETQYLRIHIRANSNSEADQAVKYLVKDAIVEALIPILSEVKTKDEAQEVMRDNFSYIEAVANGVLESEGFYYGSNAKLDNEYFPTRTYSTNESTITLAEGYYDALVLELGSGEGNNWWCLVYPAFCFTTTTNYDNIVYISKIWDIIKSCAK